MTDYFIDIKDQLPEKGKDIIAIDENDNTHYCFKCACPNPKCNEYRCSITGGALMFLDIIKWKYETK